MDGVGDLEQRKAMIDAAERGLALLGEKAIAEEWPADERAALSDERDTVADENDAVALALDGRADRRDFDAALRQAGTDLRAMEGAAADPPTDSSFDTYMATLDRKGTVADRKSSASDRKRSAADRKTAAGARRRAAGDRDEAGRERAKAELPEAAVADLTARRRQRRAAGA